MVILAGEPAPNRVSIAEHPTLPVLAHGWILREETGPKNAERAFGADAPQWYLDEVAPLVVTKCA